MPAPLLRSVPPYFGRGVIHAVVRDPDTEVHSVVTARFDDPGA